MAIAAASRVSLRSTPGYASATIGSPACAFALSRRSPALGAGADAVIGGKTATHTASELLARADAVTVTIPRDVAYGRSMTYRAIPLAALLPAVGAAATVRFTASDGFAATLPARQLLAADGDGARAWLAVEPADAPWPPLKAGEPASAGPFYLVWTQPERGRIVPEQWPYPDRAHRRDAAARGPLSGDRPRGQRLAADGPVNRGFATFTKNCIVCHTLNLGRRRIDRTRPQRSLQSHRVPARRPAAALHTRSAVAAAVAVDADAGDSTPPS